MTFPIKQWLLRAAFLLAVYLPLSGHTQPYFANKQGDQIWDQATGLVWQRCSFGQNWDQGACIGAAKQLGFDAALGQASKDWRVPTIRELASLIHCSKGKSDNKIDVNDGRLAIGDSCDMVKQPHASPTINIIAFPETLPEYWSASQMVDYPKGAWSVEFLGGQLKKRHRFGGYAVRLVRTSRMSKGEAVLEFTVPMEELTRVMEIKRQEQLDQERRADAKRQEDQRKADLLQKSGERRARENRMAAQRSLIAGGAQSLYLQAGRAQRNGSIEHGGVSFYAKELYEMVIEKFPSSEFAVKASDQLNAMDRMDRTNRNESNRAACFSEVNTCTARCRASGMNYDGVTYCIERCQKNCR